MQSTVPKIWSFLRILTLTSLSIVGCSDSSLPSNQAAPCQSETCPIDAQFAGSWILNSIRCDEQSSPIPDSVLADEANGISVVVTYRQDQGERTFKMGGCSISFPMSGIQYGSESVHISEGQANCAGDCSAFAAQCAAGGSTADYPYQLSEGKLTLTIPQTNNSQDPCYSNWSKKVTFHYLRK